MSLARRTTIGVLWNFFEQLARRGIGIFVTLILARLLVPADFGLIAMMSVFLTIAITLMESGFRQALIRLPEAKEVDFNTAFYSNILLGLLAYIVLYFLAPFIAEFYEESQLTLLLRVSGIIVVIDSFQLVQRASLSRTLNFKAQVKAALPAAVISGIVAVCLALLGVGVWALVGQVISSALVITVLLWLTHGWRPKMQFSTESFRNLYLFGVRIFLTRIIDTVFKNLYVLIIAKFFTVTITGFYYLAYQIKSLIVLQLVNSIQTVTFPSLSKMQGDIGRLKEGYRKVVKTTSFLLFPALLCGIAISQLAFELILGNDWIEAAFYLQILLAAALLFPLISLNINIMKVMGRSDLLLKVTIVQKALTLAIIVISVQFGIYALLWGTVASSIISFFIFSYYSGGLITYSTFEQISDIFPIFTSALVSILIGFGLVQIVHISPIIDLILILVIFSITYLFSAIIFKSEVLGFLRDLVVKLR